MPRRVLIIGADFGTASDLMRAQRLIAQFDKDAVTYNKGLGRHHSIAYGREDTVLVWQTRDQITVKFCGRDNDRAV